MRRGVIAALIASLSVLVAPGVARADVDPWSVVGGANSKWFSGSLIQQIGANCSILGSQYTEVMVSGVGSYGGTQGVVRVNDPYWVALMVAIPGNPCGTGSSAVTTDLVFPKNTIYDSSRPIRCFGTPRSNPDNLLELTNESWSFLGHSGRYCPTGPSVAPIGKRFGYRPLANGQFFWIFVPVKTTSTLVGAGGPDEFNWLTYSTGVYANPDRSQIWANVFANSGGNATTPYVYFARQPAAIPFWCTGCPAGTENRVEFFANLYSAGLAGNLCFKIERTDIGPPGNAVGDCTILGGAWNPAVPAGGSLFQVYGTGAALGPNGGYVPFYYEQSLGEWDKPMKITWTFTYAGGSKSGTANFRTLAGSGDQDQCDVPPPLPAGCTLPPLPKLKGSVPVKTGQKLSRAKLATGLKLVPDCNLASTATAKIMISAALARTLGLARTIGSAAAVTCNADGKALTLKLTAKAASKLRGRTVAATLSVTFKRAGSTTFTFVRAVKIG